MRSTALHTPWVVVYATNWRDGSLERNSSDGSLTVDFIDDCHGHHVIQTDSGVYAMDPEVAEFLVKCVNEMANQYAV